MICTRMTYCGALKRTTEDRSRSIRNSTKKESVKNLLHSRQLKRERSVMLWTWSMVAEHFCAPATAIIGTDMVDEWVDQTMSVSVSAEYR